MERLGEKADALGVVLDEKTIAGTARMGEVWTTVLTRMQGNFSKFASFVLIGLDNIYGLTESGQVQVLSSAADEIKAKISDAEADLKAVQDRISEADLYGNNPHAKLLEQERSRAAQRHADLMAELGITEAQIEKIAERAKAAADAVNKLREPPELEIGEYPGGGSRTDEAKAEQDELTEIERQGWADRLDAVLRGGQDMAGAISENNNKAAKALKAFAAAEALINAYRAASQTLADPTLPFYAKFAAMASVLAQGMSLVNSIKSVSSSGGGARSAGQGGGASDAASATYYNVSLQGEGPVSMGSVRDLIGMINDEIDNGAVIRGITVS
jgi:hypothetical protein